MTDAAATLARLYLQTLGLALLFVGTGHYIHARLTRPGRVEGLAMQWGRGYFLGITAFLPVFVFLSRALGAQRALWIALALMAAASALALARVRREGFSLRRVGGFVMVVLALLGFYSVTNAALWLAGLPPSGEAGLLSHFGSIHAGRYANYAVFIAEHDRVPFLAQNGAQSMLASVHLLLGLDRPLAAITVWLPCSIAFLTLLVFGLMRSAGFPRAACAAATFLVMFCNVAVSSIHVLVFDNGSPLAFIGYTDMVLAVGTFIVFARWFGRRMLSEEAYARGELALPALLGVTWAWYAPQNIVIGGFACAAATLLWARTRELRLPRRAIVEIAAAFGVAIAIGGTQFGSFLPHALREDTGFWTQDVQPVLQLRPYVNYMRSHWTVPRWKEPEPGVYENVYAYNKPIGPDEVYRNFAWLAEENLWASIRAYGFVLLGLALMFVALRRRARVGVARSPEWEGWWLIAALSFAAGYAITYFFELGHMKWWLTRFLVPGSALALTCLGFAWLAMGGGSAARRLSWAVLLAAATFGPVTELMAVAYRNFVAVAHSDPFIGRLAILLERKGPFVFETLLPQPDAAARDAQGAIVVGGDGRREGLAVESPPMPVARGRHRVGYRIEVPKEIAAEAPLMELDVVDSGGAVVAKRVIGVRDLERRGDREWAWMEFELARESEGMRLRVWNRSSAGFRVVSMRLEKQ